MKALIHLALAAVVALAAPAQAADDPAFARTVAVARAAGLAGEIVLTDADGTIGDEVLGLADRAGRLHRAGERWVWASVTKQIAAVLVMQEVQAGRLSLEAPVTRYLPAFKGATGAEITLRDLLQHRSGLPNPSDAPAGSTELQPFYRERGAGVADTPRALGFCAGTPKGKPGGDFAYNNCDYLVLGAILQATTGRPFGALVAERIAAPLGLKSVRMAPDGVRDGGSDVAGYSGAERYPRVMNIATGGAAAALTGSAADLAAFDRALLGDRLLTRPSRDVLWAGDPKLGYEAMGVWSFPASLKGCKGPVALVERRGDFGGVAARNIIAPGLGKALVVLVNDDTADFGEIWQGKGLSYDLLSAAFCPAP